MPENLDRKTMAYVKSEAEFNHAKIKGFLENMMSLIRGHNLHLLSFNEVADKLRLKHTKYRGLQDIPLANIVGSSGRYEDFTRHFLPRGSDKQGKERWRNIYTLAVTGQGFPPIDVYKIDQVYFVKDGNHRVSVAKELGWETIQAYVTELPSTISLDPNVSPDELIIKGECAYFLEQTELDQRCPDFKEHIDFSAPGGYELLLKHIELHRYLINKEQNASYTLPEAAADWYKNVYLPMIAVVRDMDVMKHFPGRCETDLYMWLIKHQAALCDRHQLEAIQLSAAVQEFLQSVA